MLPDGGGFTRALPPLGSGWLRLECSHLSPDGGGFTRAAVHRLAADGYGLNVARIAIGLKFLPIDQQMGSFQLRAYLSSFE